MFIIETSAAKIMQHLQKKPDNFWRVSDSLMFLLAS